MQSSTTIQGAAVVVIVLAIVTGGVESARTEVRENLDALIAAKDLQGVRRFMEELSPEARATIVRNFDPGNSLGLGDIRRHGLRTKLIQNFTEAGVDLWLNYALKGRDKVLSGGVATFDGLKNSHGLDAQAIELAAAIEAARDAGGRLTRGEVLAIRRLLERRCRVTSQAEVSAAERPEFGAFWDEWSKLPDRPHLGSSLSQIRLYGPLPVATAGQIRSEGAGRSAKATKLKPAGARPVTPRTGTERCVQCSGYRIWPCLGCAGIGKELIIDLTDEAQVLVKETKQPCRDCKGTKHVVCPLCLGEGDCTADRNELIAQCPHCAGRQTVMCKQCGGSGSEDVVVDLTGEERRNPPAQKSCGDCAGDKVVMCYVCVGAGTVPTTQVAMYHEAQAMLSKVNHTLMLRQMDTRQSKSLWEREKQDYAEYYRKKLDLDDAELRYQQTPNAATERRYHAAKKAYTDAESRYVNTDYGRGSNR